MIPVFYDPGFSAPIGDNHIMPMRKFALVAERLRADPRARFHDVTPIAETDLARVHTAEYLAAIATGEPRALAESQKFPWSPALYPAVRLTNGGLLAAARAALENRAYNDLSVTRHADGPNHHSVALPNGTRGPELLAILKNALPLLLAGGKPDLLLYQAGADPYREDPYSPLDLGHEDLRARDLLVFEFCRDHAIPVAWVLAGGYTPDVTQVVQVHVNTFESCAEVYSP